MTSNILEIPHLYDRYMHSRCLIMAGALSRETGMPTGRLWAPECGCLVHGFLIVDSKAKNREKWLGADVKGIRPVSELRNAHRKSHGKLIFRKDYTAHVRDPQLDEPDEVLLLIAGRIPHLAPLLDSKWIESDPVIGAMDITDAIRRIVASSQKIASYRNSQETWGWTEEWVASRIAPRTGMAG